jgi:hypothetical protein
MASAPEAWVEWRAIASVHESPTLHRIFEDEVKFLEDLSTGEAIARLDAEDKSSGTSSLRITPGEKSSGVLPGLAAKIRENPRLGEYRFLRFAWKKSGGGAIRLHLANDGQWGSDEAREASGSLRYLAGPESGGVRSVSLDAKAPEQWQVVIRDLYGDFGAFQLTGLRLECLGGGSAAFDGISLGRRREDFEPLDGKIDDPFTHLGKEEQQNVLVAAHTNEELPRALSEFTPAFSCSTIGWHGLWLLKDYRAQPRVLRTAPPSDDKPCVLRAPVVVPPGAKLQLSVAPHEGRAWKLEVFVNGDRLHEAEVSKDSAPSGWLDAELDLSRFAGENVLIELKHHSPSNSFGYWKRIEIAGAK